MDERKLQERSRTNLARRRLSTGLCLGLLTTLAGCGGSGDDLLPNVSAPASTPAGGTPGGGTPTVASTTWDVVPNRALAIAAGGTFNLAATLPENAATGGIFEVDPSGAPLPDGITLSPTGLLSVSSSATGGTAGVVFRYTPPA